jgi:hypothetical protein
MTFHRSSTFFTASVAVHLVLGALLFRSDGREAEEAAPAPAKLTGETLSLPEDLMTEGVQAPSENAGTPPTPSPPATRAALSPSGPSSHAASTSASNGAKGGAAASIEPGIYGAAGDRSASDVSSAFTRAFPQAASADPVWLSVPFGRAGSAQVSLEIDAGGAFVGARIDDRAPPALRRGIERTVALIRARAFTAHAALTSLQVSATVSPDDVHDGLHGEVFAIGGSFEGRQGNAFFALAAGRRIDLVVRGAQLPPQLPRGVSR